MTADPVRATTSAPGAPTSWLDDLEPGALDAAVDRLATATRDGACIVLAAHVAPDGDALGAALALHLALRAAGAHTVPTVGEQPLKVPAALVDLPGVDALVPAPQLPPPDEVDLLVTVDAASPSRLGSVAGYLDASVHTVVLDHHAASTPFGDVRVVAPRAAATVLIAAELLDRLGLPITRDVATCLYVGLVTDTGRFGHAATDRAAMELGGRLLAAGIDHAEWTRRLFDTRSLGALRLIGRALERMAFVPDVALVHTHLTDDEVAASGAGVDATEALADLLRSADVAEVALVLKPNGHDAWRASLRSKGRVDVGRVATALGGGGHAFASGFDADGDPAAVAARVADLLRAA